MSLKTTIILVTVNCYSVNCWVSLSHWGGTQCSFVKAHPKNAKVPFNLKCHLFMQDGSIRIIGELIHSKLRGLACTQWCGMQWARQLDLDVSDLDSRHSWGGLRQVALAQQQGCPKVVVRGYSYTRICSNIPLTLGICLKRKAKWLNTLGYYLMAYERARIHKMWSKDNCENIRTIYHFHKT